MWSYRSLVGGCFCPLGGSSESGWFLHIGGFFNRVLVVT